jgi:hypothetical protein
LNVLDIVCVVCVCAYILIGETAMYYLLPKNVHENYSLFTFSLVMLWPVSILLVLLNNLLDILIDKIIDYITSKKWQ